MLIRVKYVDDRYDMVRQEILDHLLETGKVREFKRSDGWVMPVIANVRSKKPNEYFSPERRMRKKETIEFRSRPITYSL